MSHTDANVIRDSVHTGTLRFNEIAERFFTSLIQTVPDLRAKLPSDTTEQRSIFAVKLNWLVENAHDLNAVAGELSAMGERLAAYGVAPEQMHTLRESLVGAASDCAGDAWTAEYEGAWTRTTYTACALMLRGSARRAA